MPKRLAIARLSHEGNSFSPVTPRKLRFRQVLPERLPPYTKGPY